MADLTLRLGDFIFQDAEIPEKISFGGEQKLAVHRLVGGGRVIDAMGRDDAALEWSGLFQGADAVRRARYLEGLRIAGAPIALTWHEFSYRVVVRSFHAPFERFYRIPYTISCEVVEDASTPVTAQATPGIQSMVSADLTPAKALAATIGDGALTQAMGQIDAALAAIPAGARISRAVQQKLLSAVQGAQQRVTALVSSANAAIQAITTIANAGSLTLQVSSMQSLGNLLRLNGLLGRIANNIGVAVDGEVTLTVSGGTLFDVAAREYGDAAQWTAIASANGMADPLISGTLDLQIPAVPDANGGVLTI